jgi:hypothetical protein
MIWRMAAELVLVIHTGLVAFVIAGFTAILVGGLAHWSWVRNSYFRIVHLAVILYVAGEALIGITCPLTIWESTLRIRGGESGYGRDFVGYWLDWLIFYNLPAWVFTTLYLILGVSAALAFWLVPPRRHPSNPRPGRHCTKVQ